MDPRDREQTVERYRSRFARFGVDPRSLGWEKGRQSVRFGAALGGLELDFKSVIDFGCGFGDLLDHLRERGWSGDYLGLDIVPEFIAEARLRHRGPGVEFRELDVTTEPLQDRAELGVAIGLLNHYLQGDPAEYTERLLNTLWKASTEVMVVDFLSTTADAWRDELHYSDPAEMLRMGLQLSRRAMLDHSYMPFECTLKVWHDDSFPRDRPVFGA